MIFLNFTFLEWAFLWWLFKCLSWGKAKPKNVSSPKFLPKLHFQWNENWQICELAKNSSKNNSAPNWYKMCNARIIYFTQWGSEYWPFDNRKHLNTKIFEVQISNGLVFKWSVCGLCPKYNIDHLKTGPVDKKPRWRPFVWYSNGWAVGYPNGIENQTI